MSIFQRAIQSRNGPAPEPNRGIVSQSPPSIFQRAKEARRTAMDTVDEEETKEESWPDYLKRNALQHAARVSETVLGFPGAAKQVFQRSRKELEEHLPEELRVSELEQKAFGKPEQNTLEAFLMQPPTSSDIREKGTPHVASKLGKDKDYLEPKNEGERFAGDLTQDITSFFLPGSGRLKLAVRLGAPVLGNLAKEGVKYAGGDQEIAEKVKMGVMLATSLSGQSNPQQFASQRIRTAREMVPKNATTNARPLIEKIAGIQGRLSRGLSVPSKSRTQQGIRDLANQIHNGKIGFHSLMDARDNINEWISEAGGWDVPRAQRDATLYNLNDLKKQITTTLDEGLTKQFPNAGELYKTGYEAAAVTHQSNAISNFIRNNFGKKVESIGIKLLFPTAIGGLAYAPKVGAAGIAAYPLYKGGQILYRVAESPTLARYYQDVITNSVSGNVPAMIESMQKLDKALLEEEKKQKA